MMTEEEQLMDVDLLEFYKLKEENDNLKNKLQIHTLEISSLKSQLKLANSLEDTKRQQPIASELVKKSTKLGKLNINAKMGTSRILQGICYYKNSLY